MGAFFFILQLFGHDKGTGSYGPLICPVSGFAIKVRDLSPGSGKKQTARL